MQKRSKPISLNSLRFSDERGNFVVTEYYGLTFNNHETTEIFVQARHKYWTDLLQKKLVFAKDDNETLEEIEINKVAKLMAKHLKISYRTMIASQKRSCVEARQFIIHICSDRKVKQSTIGVMLGYKRNTINYHLRKSLDLIETNKEYRERYYEAEDYILSKINGNFLEDGSGTKI